jgi:hypothetical protein
MPSNPLNYAVKLIGKQKEMWFLGKKPLVSYVETDGFQQRKRCFPYWKIPFYNN